MSTPLREQISYFVSLGLCRKEIQKVLREHYASGMNPMHCLFGFLYSFQLLYPAKFNARRAAAVYHWKIGEFLHAHPTFLAKMIIAMERSGARMALLPENSVDVLVETNFPLLADRRQYKKLAEALPQLKTPAQLRAARARISVLNRTAFKWSNIFYQASKKP